MRRVVDPARPFRALLTVLCCLQLAPTAWADDGATNCILGTYVDAVVSAGSTAYVFRHASGVELSVSVPNEIESAIELEPNLLRLLTDGPAEANEALLGEAFGICLGPENAVRINAIRNIGGSEAPPASGLFHLSSTLAVRRETIEEQAT